MDDGRGGCLGGGSASLPPLPAGAHAARWDGRDDAGRAVAAGVYFAALRCGDDRATLKLMLLK